MLAQLFEYVPFLVGLLVTIALGEFSGWFLDEAVNIRQVPPWGITKEEWDSATIEMIGKSGAQVIGFLERLLFFGLFWIAAHIAVAGWLAFKVAAKWSSWQHIIKIPKQLGRQTLIDQIQYLKSRNRLGTYLHSRFLIGALYNLLCALIGFGVGQVCKAMLPALWSAFHG
jgi:hypothetical protein